jgi:hypothetical protein
VTKLARIFVLDKREQRVVILIVVMLVAMAIAKRFHDEQGSTKSQTSANPAGTPSVVRPEKAVDRSDDEDQ